MIAPSRPRRWGGSTPSWNCEKNISLTSDLTQNKALLLRTEGDAEKQGAPTQHTMLTRRFGCFMFEYAVQDPPRHTAAVQDPPRHTVHRPKRNPRAMGRLSTSRSGTARQGTEMGKRAQTPSTHKDRFTTRNGKRVWAHAISVRVHGVPGTEAHTFRAPNTQDVLSTRRGKRRCLVVDTHADRERTLAARDGVSGTSLGAQNPVFYRFPGSPAYFTKESGAAPWWWRKGPEAGYSAVQQTAVSHGMATAATDESRRKCNWGMSVQTMHMQARMLCFYLVDSRTHSVSVGTCRQCEDGELVTSDTEWISWNTPCHEQPQRVLRDSAQWMPHGRSAFDYRAPDRVKPEIWTSGSSVVILPGCIASWQSLLCYSTPASRVGRALPGTDCNVCVLRHKSGYYLRAWGPRLQCWSVDKQF